MSTVSSADVGLAITPHLLDLVIDATLKSFWRHRALATFLRRCGIADMFLAGWIKDESKRDLLNRLFPLVERSPQGPAVITKMARSLAEQSSFPDLEGWENSAEKKRDASAAVRALREYLEQVGQEATDRREREEIKRRARAAQQHAVENSQNLDKLARRLDQLSKDVGSQEAGYKFQDWYYDLLDYFEAICRRPYVVDGRQIDGSVTVDGTTYLNELKFTREQANAPDVDVFRRKVESKADNTMGVMVSMAGYSAVAIEAGSGPRTPLLLLDHTHLYFLLSGTATIAEIITRVRKALIPDWPSVLADSGVWWLKTTAENDRRRAGKNGLAGVGVISTTAASTPRAALLRGARRRRSWRFVYGLCRLRFLWGSAAREWLYVRQVWCVGVHLLHLL